MATSGGYEWPNALLNVRIAPPSPVQLPRESGNLARMQPRDLTCNPGLRESTWKCQVRRRTGKPRLMSNMSLLDGGCASLCGIGSSTNGNRYPYQGKGQRQQPEGDHVPQADERVVVMQPELVPMHELVPRRSQANRVAPQG